MAILHTAQTLYTTQYVVLQWQVHDLPAAAMLVVSMGHCVSRQYGSQYTEQYGTAH